MRSTGTETGVVSPPAPPPKRPPKPPLVFHVGVTGHRPDATKRPDPDVTAIRETLGEVLGLIRDAVNGIAQSRGALFQAAGQGDTMVRPTLRCISSLAEGADQWAADEAVTRGYFLHVPLPFERVEYSKDFQPIKGAKPVDPVRGDQLAKALEEFERLIGHPQVQAVFELDGTRSNGGSSKSYLAAGRQVIQQSDVLIAVWDGNDEKGAGGTGQVVREALISGVPVVWVRWTPAPKRGKWKLLDEPQWQLLEQSEELKDDATRLRGLVSDILLPSDVCENRRHLERHSLRPFFSSEEQRRKTWIGGFWAFFLGVMCPRNPRTGELEWPAWKFKLSVFEEKTAQDWQEETDEHSALKAGLSLQEINKTYLPHYAWANHLSMYYGGLYRSSFVLNYLLAALAVFFALLGIPALIRDQIHMPTIITESLLIMGIVLLTKFGKARRWHERWLEYRSLAERLRLSRLMALLGGWRQQTAMPGHLATYGDPVTSWVHWHYRAVERAAGLPNGTMDERRLEEIKMAFQEVLTRGQIQYHEANAKRLRIVDHRLHALAAGLFIATLIACVTHLILEWSLPGVPGWMAMSLIMLNALFPVCGAAAAAICNQGEFQRLVRRSEAMQEALTKLLDQLSMITPTGNFLKSQDLRRGSERVAQLMLNETLDWRIVFQDRPLTLPA